MSQDKRTQYNTNLPRGAKAPEPAVLPLRTAHEGERCLIVPLAKRLVHLLQHRPQPRRGLGGGGVRGASRRHPEPAPAGGAVQLGEAEEAAGGRPSQPRAHAS